MLSLFVASCQKENFNEDVNVPRGAQQLSIFLSDDPCEYDSVFVDIQFVEVKIDSSKNKDDDDFGDDEDEDEDDDRKGDDKYGKWDTLRFTPGVYNLLALRNGIDTLLSTDTVLAGNIRKVRFTLGTRNAVVKDSVRYPLEFLAGNNKYAYVKIHDEDEDRMANNRKALRIDFDVCESIKFRNGRYFLKPYLKAFSTEGYGKIEGKVLPREARPFVRVFNATDSATALPEDDGEFEIRGIREGTYSITYSGQNGYRDTTINNIQVRRGKEVELRTITLRK